ncbi:hypothetical protein NXG27_05930 [Megasphaera paucivorans]|uniref:Propionate CoA-transferase n=1 Tax=Megasphaera paucivorans TaxID=349095 RepID=A0A1H0B7G9_9FIRM|nr:CoA-transferase [Megasphaera paucivorans]SDN41635.1 propionate CoA-transferase [Megasphaera paucivorans]
MKVISSLQVAQLIEDGATVGVGGFGSYSAPDEILQGIEKNYQINSHPGKLTIFSSVCSGNNTTADIGHNRLTPIGLVDTVIAAHFKNADKLYQLVGENKIAGFTLPLGTIVDLLRSAVANQPGVITRIGLNTYVDPRQGTCAVNEKARQQQRDLVSVVEINDNKYLFYKTIPLNACIIRGTYADEQGNISFEHEGIQELQFLMALAAHNNNGIVIVQVENIVQNGSIPARKIGIHHSIVDYVVIAKPENHFQSYAVNSYHPELSGELRIPQVALKPMDFNIRKIIARRGVLELQPNSVINLGIGIPSGVGSIANEEGIATKTILSLESGPLGGVPAEGTGFGGSANFEAMYALADNLKYYDGGGLDMAFLGLAEVDQNGDVNVSHFGRGCAGPGGFIDITQNTSQVYFMGTFTVTRPRLEINNEQLSIQEDGQGIKFVKKVQEVTFSADYARKYNRKILYITERAVFRLTEHGIMLIEIAPGIDLQQDILAHMKFQPIISKDLKLMDKRLFSPEKMGIHF